MSKILNAQHINRALGGAFIGPDEVDELPDDFLDACEAICRIPEMAREIKR